MLRGYHVPAKVSLFIVTAFHTRIGPLRDPVTWYGINYAGTKITLWDFQTKEVELDWYGFLRFESPAVEIASQHN